jgi:hypothetical protein
MNGLVDARRVCYCRGRSLPHRVAALGVGRWGRKDQNRRTCTQCGRIFEKDGEGTKKREDWCGSRSDVKRMILCRHIEGDVIRKHDEARKINMEESGQGEHRWR